MFSNFYFLVITISQLFPPLRVGYFVTYIFPLCLVLLIAIIKEGIEDVTRYFRDREINNSLVPKYNPKTKMWDDVFCKSLMVGDIVQLRDRVPADCLILSTLNEEGTCFIKTDQLDGETDWKQKRAVTATFQQLKSAEGRQWFYNDLNCKKFSFECDIPNMNI